MDRVDREILSALQVDARLSITALAERAKISVSTCHRRLRDLETLGTIEGYQTQLNLEAIGLGFQALAFVTMQQGTTATLTKFEAAVQQIPEVIDASRLFGEPDYLLKIVTKDLESYQRLYDQELASLPGVLRLSTTIVMKQVVRSRVLPIPAST